MRAKTLALVGLVALFLYWVVQAPIAAADAISQMLDWSMNLLELIAARFVEFLDALM